MAEIDSDRSAQIIMIAAVYIQSHEAIMISVGPLGILSGRARQYPV